MAQYTKTVPKDPTSCDKTLKAVLEAIIFFTHDGDEFVSFINQRDKVTLTFEGED